MLGLLRVILQDKMWIEVCALVVQWQGHSVLSVLQSFDPWVHRVFL